MALDIATASTNCWPGLDAAVLGRPSWPDHLDAEMWRTLLGRPARGIVVLTDEQVGASHGQLRALPLLRALGVTRFSFVDSWRGLDLVPYTWCRVAADTSVHDLVSCFPICQIVSQQIEDSSPGDATDALMRARDLAGPEALLVYVFDTALFSRRRDLQVRPFVDEYNLGFARDYAALARSYVTALGLVSGEPLISSNLAWQGLAAGRRPGTRARRLEDILNPNHHRADSPIWALYAHLCAVGGAEGDAAAVRPVLRSWIDREITRATDQVILWLQRFGFNPHAVERRRLEQERREY